MNRDNESCIHAARRFLLNVDLWLPPMAVRFGPGFILFAAVARRQAGGFMENREPQSIPVSSIRVEDGARELVRSEKMKPYLELLKGIGPSKGILPLGPEW